MERAAKLVSRTPPEGLTDWENVTKFLPMGGLIYEDAVYSGEYMDPYSGVKNPGRGMEVIVRCSVCGGEMYLPYARTDKRRGGYGYRREDENCAVDELVGSGDTSVCPICGEPVLVRKASEVRRKGYFVTGETQAMSAVVVGMDRYLVLTGWTIQRRVFESGYDSLRAIPAEAYVFGREDCRKLMGWRKSYSGNAGYFVSYYPEWHEPEKWNESWGPVQNIYGLTPDLVERSCLPNCKLDVYMESFRAEKAKYPVMYLRLYQARRNVENLLVSGLPMVLDDLLDEVYHGFCWPEENIHGNIPMALAPMTEFRWGEVRPDRMLGLTKEELRLGREQCWDAFFWRLFVRTKAQGERLTGEDINNVFLLGDQNTLGLVGQGPVGKSIRYLLRQQERYDWAYNDPYVEEEDYEELGEPVPGAYSDVTTLLDYWAACRALGRNLDDPQVRFPGNLIEAHDAALEQRRIAEAKKAEKSLAPRFRVRRRQLAKYIFEADGLKISPAGSRAELQKEADTLHHCVWTYAQRHANGETAIFFIRRTVEPWTPYYTLELDEKKLKVRQNRGLRNCGKTEAVQAFEDLWLSWVRAGAKRDERGRPVLPRVKQEARSA